jgi:hypothetical protein
MSLKGIVKMDVTEKGQKDGRWMELAHSVVSCQLDSKGSRLPDSATSDFDCWA